MNPISHAHLSYIFILLSLTHTLHTAEQSETSKAPSKIVTVTSFSKRRTSKSPHPLDSVRSEQALIKKFILPVAQKPILGQLGPYNDGHHNAFGGGL